MGSMEWATPGKVDLQLQWARPLRGSDGKRYLQATQLSLRCGCGSAT